MKRIPAIFCLLALLLPCLAMAQEPCQHARSVSTDYVCQVQQEQPLGDEAFEDALIIGDSITLSLYDYDIIPTLRVEGYIGQSPIAAHKIRNMRYNGENVSMFELAAAVQPGKMLVMLGANGLDFSTFDKVAVDYHALVDDLLDALPESEIYLLGVTPVRPKVQQSEDAPLMTLQKIERFNAFLYDLALSHGVHYIDLYTPLLGEDGVGLKLAYSMPDGIHLSIPGAQMLGDTIRKGILP